MTLQELPKTAAETTLKLVRLPVELVTKVREAVEERLGGDEDVVFEPVGEPTKAKAAKPKPAKKPAAKKPAKAKAKATAKKPTATKAATPTASTPAAERPEVIAEHTDGLGHAVDRAQSERRKLTDDAGRA
jgi:hypothetical protein